MFRARHSLCKLLLALILIPGLTFVFASGTIPASHQNYDALYGVYANVTRSLIAIDGGIGIASQAVSPAGGSQGSPVVFSASPGLATQGVVAGDWVITTQVNVTASTPIGTTYVVVLNFNESNSSHRFVLYIATGSSVSTNPPLEILCKFDIGQSISSPYSYTLSIQ